MKGYKFNLETLLKIRKITEDLCKQEIGRLQVKKKEYTDLMAQFSNDVDEMYKEQEQTLEEGATGQETKFFSFFFEGKRAHINQIKENVIDLDEEIRKKFLELNYHRANVKLVQKMKEKDFKKYKTALNKKQANELEETVQMWNLSQKG